MRKLLPVVALLGLVACQSAEILPILPPLLPPPRVEHTDQDGDGVFDGVTVHADAYGSNTNVLATSLLSEN